MCEDSKWDELQLRKKIRGDRARTFVYPGGTISRRRAHGATSGVVAAYSLHIYYIVTMPCLHQ